VSPGTPRLNATTLATVAAGGGVPSVDLPDYRTVEHGVGIVHLGLGAFHRAHQAWCTDRALAASGGDWRIRAASLRSTDTVDELMLQDGLFSVLERDAAGTRARVVGSLAGGIAAARDPQALERALSDPALRIVTLTVTEKAYAAGQDGEPSAVVRCLVEALARRRQTGVEPFTALCCDNLAANGEALRRVTLHAAERRDAPLARWIEANMAFPSSMVDRIVPAPTDSTREAAAALLGLDDRLSVQTEPFFQWVIEDRFGAGRPDWEAGGAQLVADVAPWESAKLAMLNGSHSLIAWAGMLLGHESVAQAVADPLLRARVRNHLRAAGAALPPGGPDTARYAEQLLARFDNPVLHHLTAQIAMDGSLKVPLRWLDIAERAAERGLPTAPFELAVALWLRWCDGSDEAGNRYDIVDPNAPAIAATVHGDGAARLAAVQDALGWQQAPFLRRDGVRTRIAAVLDRLLDEGVRAVLAGSGGEA